MLVFTIFLLGDTVSFAEEVETVAGKKGNSFQVAAGSKALLFGFSLIKGLIPNSASFEGKYYVSSNRAIYLHLGIRNRSADYSSEYDYDRTVNMDPPFQDYYYRKSTTKSTSNYHYAWMRLGYIYGLDNLRNLKPFWGIGSYFFGAYRNSEYFRIVNANYDPFYLTVRNNPVSAREGQDRLISANAGLYLDFGVEYFIYENFSLIVAYEAMVNYTYESRIERKYEDLILIEHSKTNENRVRFRYDRFRLLVACYLE